MKITIGLMIMIALTGLYAEGAAASQSCSIASARVLVSENTVTTWGDLKIRINAINWSQVVVDIKAPNFSVANVTLAVQVPQRFSICGQEVTVTYETYPPNRTINVSAF